MKAKIEFSNEKRVCHLSNREVSLVLEVKEGKVLTYRYFGKKIKEFNNSFNQPFISRGFSTTYNSENYYSLSEELIFSPTKGMGDFRISALDVTADDINHIELKFKDWKILDAKPSILNLPSSFESKESGSLTLQITQLDQIAGLELITYLTIFDIAGIITRSSVIKNYSNKEITINKATSLSLDFYPQDFDFFSLTGAHTNEANINEFKLHKGVQKIESTRGASSPQHNPFIGLKAPNTDQYQGNCYGFNLIYSGSFLGEVELSQYEHIRVQLGLNPEVFEWKLNAGQEFYTPEAVLNYSDKGLNGLSQNFHEFYKNNLITSKWNNKERPLLINTWESMYFDITEEKVLNLASKAKEVGIELLVLDDGWFENRNNDKTGLGDWVCDKTKLPNGIEGLATKINDLGMKFGLWFEPEMASLDSNVIKENPSWIIRSKGYDPAVSRYQFVLDLSNDDVIEYLKTKLDSILECGKISYIKWDMNRNITDVSNKQLQHKYILGLYKLLNYLTNKYPEILFESCASGGGRLDPGMLYYMPQCWTSDNSDAISRLKIQSGYSLMYSPMVLTNHITTSPNHQIGRVTELKVRYNIGSFFNLGVELNLENCSQEELDDLKQYISQYKNDRKFLLDSQFYRLQTTDSNDFMWLIINKEKTEFKVLIAKVLSKPGIVFSPFKLKYLNPEFKYQNQETQESYYGDELMENGVSFPRLRKDFQALVYHFKKIN
ncbi:alpha-galactosidase [Spiroplasma chinense]|uniref:Alpha-galactosidase n=1 Tax=Spiroplasma chinense TaxID=216932 RepID=A0A5B9Y657_9MOLU|nr:alpha-galactosidase [Spiroplasma chinense]QEH62179.1 alpha-galactosidase [Spiroplasma chinense]